MAQVKINHTHDINGFDRGTETNDVGVLRRALKQIDRKNHRREVNRKKNRGK